MKKIKQICENKNISIAELSYKTGISHNTIESYYYNRREPSFINGVKIAEVLGVHPKELLDD